MAESEEELKSFLMNVKEESEKVGLKLFKRKFQKNFKKFQKKKNSENEDHASPSHHFMANRWGNSG